MSFTAALTAVEDVLLPRCCPSCPQRAAPLLCSRCARALDALVLEDAGALELAEGVIAVGGYAYDGVARDVVHGIKFGGRWAAAPGLGALLRTRLALPATGQIATTWVPSTRRRLRQRGVDVPRLLAGAGAVPLLVKTAERADQTTLAARERRRNPRGAFAARAGVPPAVVLVDDVRTTGATATAAALALRAAGARRVLVVTFAVAGDEHVVA